MRTPAACGSISSTWTTCSRGSVMGPRGPGSSRSTMRWCVTPSKGWLVSTVAANAGPENSSRAATAGRSLSRGVMDAGQADRRRIGGGSPRLRTDSASRFARACSAVGQAHRVALARQRGFAGPTPSVCVRDRFLRRAGLPACHGGAASSVARSRRFRLRRHGRQACLPYGTRHPPPAVEPALSCYENDFVVDRPVLGAVEGDGAVADGDRGAGPRPALVEGVHGRRPVPLEGERRPGRARPGSARRPP